MWSRLCINSNVCIILENNDEIAPSHLVLSLNSLWKQIIVHDVYPTDDALQIGSKHLHRFVQVYILNQ